MRRALDVAMADEPPTGSALVSAGLQRSTIVEVLGSHNLGSVSVRVIESRREG